MLPQREKERPLHTGRIEAFEPGKEISDPCPGDFILTHGTSWTSRMIRIGERIRYRGDDRKYARWNHAAIFINEQGDIIEALGGGVQKRNISVYRETEYHVVRLQNVLALNRDHEVEFAEACLHAHSGWLTIVSIALSLLTTSKVGFGVDGQEICSALVARCLERTGEIFPTDPWRMTPADLAKYFKVQQENPKASIGTVPDPKAGVQESSN
jgi:hypothetical protein